MRKRSRQTGLVDGRSQAGYGIGLALCGLLALAGCSPGGHLQPLPDASSTAYILGSGDKMRIITFGEDQLTGEFSISDSGNVAIPLLGVIHAAGMSPDQLGRRVAQTLKDKKLFSDPSVSVEVIRYRPIFVLGEVSKPGEYPYQPGMTMLTAVAVAGGFTYRAVEQYASDVRIIDNKGLEGRITRESLLQAGDVVTIFERTF